MLTANQRKKFEESFKSYKRKYVSKKYADLDESGTRIMINSFLTEVLGYAELEEIKTEFRIRSTYADYVIQIGKKQRMVIEVKAMQLDLSENHIRQAVHYGADEGIDWVLLTNGREFALYRVIFSKPIDYKQVFHYNISDLKEFKKALPTFEYLTRKCMVSGDLEKFWKMSQAVEPQNLCKYLYQPEVVRFVKRSLKKDSGLTFSEEEVYDSLHEIIITEIESKKPRFKK